MRLIEFIQDKVVASIAVVLFMFSCLWMLVEAISRQFFHKSYSISEEVIVFSLIWAIFLTLGQSGKEGNHIFVDLFVNRLKIRFKKVTSILTYLIGFLFACFIVYVGINYIQHLLNTGITSQSALKLPMGYVYLAVPIGMLFFALYYLQAILKEFTKGSDLKE